MAATIQFIHSVLRIKEVQLRTGLCRSTIYDKLNAKSKRYDPSFPKPINLGKHAVGFIATEVNAWIAAQMNARNITS
jgi:prophage regulatory protein